MAWNLSIKGNYFYAIDTEDPFTVNDCPKSEVRIAKSNTSSTSFRFIYRGLDVTGMSNVPMADIIAENGTDFTDLATFETWKNENTGKSDASANGAGWFDYNDSATAITPITITGGGGFVDLTNDELGGFTNKNYPPFGITDVYDADNNRFDWSELKLGDTVDIRLDLEVITSSTNTEIDVFLLMADGVGSYQIPFVAEQNYKTVGTYNVNRYNGVYMGDSNTLDNFAKFQMKSDKTCTVKVNGWYCKVTQR